jgi:hypothetical protein
LGIGSLSYAEARRQAETEGAPVPAVEVNVDQRRIVDGARAKMRCYSTAAKKARKSGRCWWATISKVNSVAGTFDAKYDDGDAESGKLFAHITEIEVRDEIGAPALPAIDPDPLPSANPMASLLFDLLEGLLQRVGYDPFDEFIRLGSYRKSAHLGRVVLHQAAPQSHSHLLGAL